MRARVSPLVLAAAVMAALLLPTTPALADRIDGDWCYNSLSFTIDGPSIVTPGGTRMTGEYDRHGFRYVVPAGEADSGARIDMTQFNDTTVEVTTSPPGGAVRTEIWRRCQLTT